MLIPYGYFKNKWALNLQKGDLLQTIDEPEIIIRVIEKSIVPINSSIAQSLSLLIYNKPIEKVFDAMFRNWKYDIQKKNVILIVYERTEKEQGLNICSKMKCSCRGVLYTITFR